MIIHIIYKSIIMQRGDRFKDKYFTCGGVHIKCKSIIQFLWIIDIFIYDPDGQTTESWNTLRCLFYLSYIFSWWLPFCEV